jgi:uncharacterized protein (TIGR02145 family)
MNKKGIALISLIVLLSACEKAISERTGNVVPVYFTTSAAGYDDSDETVRNLSMEEPETVVVPMGDNLFLYATLQPDPAEEQDSEELREALTNGQKVRIAAFNTTTGLQEGTTVTYTRTGGKLVPDGDPIGVEPDNTTVYRFVAYSYYAARTTDPVETGITPSQDLIWGFHEKKIEDTEASRTVPIEMKHKFSRVKVKIDASTVASTIVSVTSVQILGGQTVNLTDIKEGTVAATGTGVNYNISSLSYFTGSGAVRTSTNYQVFYPSPTGVSIGAMTLTLSSTGMNKTYNNISADFTKALTPGKSYTLVVDIKKLTFAKSNIYWDIGANKLTFDQTGTISGSEYYQGVGFRWGSLVGVSPVGGEITATKNNVIVYVPTGGGNWDGTKTAGTSTWGEITDIPYFSTTPPGGDHYLYSQGFTAYTGDICSYLTNGVWRMPRRAEFDSILTGSGGLFDNGGTATNINAAGTGTITSGYTVGSPSAFFPLSGRRAAYGTWANNSGDGTNIAGHYWSSSVYSETHAYSLLLASYNRTNHDQHREEFYSIRCIKIS